MRRKSDAYSKRIAVQTILELNLVDVIHVVPGNERRPESCTNLDKKRSPAASAGRGISRQTLETG